MADLVVPPLGESITEAVVARWLKNVGDAARADEPVVDLETDKVTVQLPAPAAGVLSEQLAAPGQTVRVGEVIGRIGDGAGKAAAVAPAAAPAAAAAPATATAAATAAASVPGNGNGRGLTPAQRKAVREGEAPVAHSALPMEPRPQTPRSMPAQTPASNEELVPMTPLRRRIAERLVQAQMTAAILTTFNEVDMSEVLALRKEHGEEFLAKHGVKLGFMSFFAKATVAALQRFPELNAEVRGDAILYKRHYDLGVAVGSGKGLVVPVVRDVDRLSFAAVEQKVGELAKRAADNKLTLDELQGATFTISNGGVYGSLMSTPILNFPQTGILGMHNIVKRPVAVGDEIALRPMMYLALSYDHRVVDGREAVQFLIAIKQRVERPDRLLFDL